MSDSFTHIIKSSALDVKKNKDPQHTCVGQQCFNFFCVGIAGVRFVTNFANYMMQYILHHIVGKVRHKKNACGWSTYVQCFDL